MTRNLLIASALVLLSPIVFGEPLSSPPGGTTRAPEGFLAKPASGNGKAILVLHAWWGLNDTLKDFCTRLANEGFVVFAPDLYHGKIADNVAGAEVLASALDARHDEARAEIRQAVKHLQENTKGSDPDVAVIGFSLGAYYALDLSNNDPDDIGSVVVFYGTGAQDFTNARARYLGHFAENDPYETPANIDSLEGMLKSAGRPATFFRYPGTGHWFFEHDRTDAYNAEAAALAWTRTLEFLQTE